MCTTTPTRWARPGWHSQAIAGVVDIALWDILGKATNQPIWMLLGGCYREKVRMYASLGVIKSADWRDRRTPLEIAKLVEENVKLGFSAIKIRMHWEYNIDVAPDVDWEMFRECKQVTGESIPLSFDANNGYSGVDGDLAGPGAFESLGIYHFEEPLMVDDYARAMPAWLTRLDSTPISAGRARVHALAVPASSIERGPKIDIIQPGRRQVRRHHRDPQNHGARRGHTTSTCCPIRRSRRSAPAANLHVIASSRAREPSPGGFTRVNEQLNALFKGADCARCARLSDRADEARTSGSSLKRSERSPRATEG